jgi:serine/threonine protein kinase/anti-anti-sigma regulatory factor
MAEASRLKITRHKTGGGCLLRLGGVLDESFDQKAFLDGTEGVVVVDLDAVQRITSFGVREWINALKELRAKELYFINCRPVVMSQFNMVAGFGGAGTVVSFYAPYVCEECDAEIEVLVDLRKDYEWVSQFDPPEMKCAACGAEAEFDDIPETYLSFVAERARPSPSPLAEKLIAGELSEVSGEEDQGPAHLKVQKEVHGNVTAFWLSGPFEEKARFKRLLDGLEGTAVFIVGGVTKITQKGMDRFAKTLTKPGVEVFLARATPDFLGHLRAHDPDAAKGKVVSLWLPGKAADTGRTVHVEATIDDLTYSPHEIFSVVGGAQLKDTVPAFGEDVLGDAAPLMTVYVDKEVAEYLKERDGTSLPEGSTATNIAGKPRAEEGDGLGRYQLTRQIGAGGMAEIFLAKQSGPEGFQKKVVLKRILPHLSQNRVFVEMFLQEARVAARILHPNVVQIHDLGRDGDQYFIAMEYVKGWDLRTVLTSAKKMGHEMPVGLACRVVSDICAGLQAAHTSSDDDGNNLGIVHRDCTPHNVLISVDGAVKLTDFGIAKAANSVLETKPGTLKGKIMYMAPEQIEDEAVPVDGRADLFAAGLILFECITGVQPFRRESHFQMMNAVLNSRIPMVSDMRHSVPPALDAIVQRALERDRDKRYANAAEFQTALEGLLVDLKEPSTHSHLAKWLREFTVDAVQAGNMGPPPFTPTTGMREKMEEDKTQIDAGAMNRATATGMTAGHTSPETPHSQPAAASGGGQVVSSVSLLGMDDDDKEAGE